MGKVLKVTMEDVARAAGVTQATVSMALRKHPKISAATQARVSAVADKLGYQTHGAISTMMARIRLRRPVHYQATLGALIPHRERAEFNENQTFQRYLKGATARALELGFKLEPFWPCLGDMTGPRMAEILRTRGIEGVIILPLPRPGPSPLDLSPFAAATIGYTLEGPALHRATTAHYEAMLTTLRQVEEAGYRRAGLVLDRNVHNRTERKWLAAFCAYQSERPDALTAPPVLLTDHTEGPESFLAWLRQHEPDAIIAGNVPIQQWLAKAGKRRAARLGVAMLGERYQQASLAGIDEHSERVGATAVEIVVAQLHRNERGLPAFPQDVHVAGEWRPGPSLPRRR
jgi:DNA-binding LacI/PurR family transcriptional regulator